MRIFMPCDMPDDSNAFSGVSLQSKTGGQWWRDGEFETEAAAKSEMARLEAIEHKPRRLVGYHYHTIE